MEARARRATDGLDLGQPFGPVLCDLAVALGRLFDGPSRPTLLVAALSDAAAGVAIAREGAPGPIEAMTVADVDAMDTDHPTARVLRELAISLARLLDGDAGLGTAKTSGELRATLADLAAQRRAVDDDDPTDDLSTPR